MVTRAATLSRPANSADDALGPPARVGWYIIIVFFGLFISWSLIAPLNGAVVANGFVKVDGNRKSIQHLDGGIVRDLRVKEGDDVEAGAILLVLDDAQARAEAEVYAKQSVVLRFTEERLRAELRLDTEMKMPADHAGEHDQDEIKAIWQAQVQQFEMRRKSLEGQRRIIDEKMAQLRSQIEGSEAQIKGLKAQLASVQKERESLVPLLDRGLVTKPRVLQLERSAAALEGQIGEIQGNIARANQGIAEQMQQSLQLGADRATEVTRELRDTQARLLEVLPKLANARTALARMVVRSPYAGQVVGLSVFSIGAVIARGEKIMDIVPKHESMIIEAQVAVDEITEVRPAMPAEIHLTAYKQGSPPTVRGEVLQVSADRFTDNRTGQPYFVTQVRVDDKSLAELSDVRLYPGMPALVMIQTVKRTAFDYFISPLTSTFVQSFRQR